MNTCINPSKQTMTFTFNILWTNLSCDYTGYSYLNNPITSPQNLPTLFCPPSNTSLPAASAKAWNRFPPLRRWLSSVSCSCCAQASRNILGRPCGQYEFPIRDRGNLKDLMLVHGSRDSLKLYTHPKFNIAAEKWWLEDYFPIRTVTFQGLY